MHLVHHLGVTRVRAVWPRCHHKNDKEEKEEMEEKPMARHQSLVRVEREGELFYEEREVEDNCENEHQSRGELKARLERGVAAMAEHEEEAEDQDEEKMKDNLGKEQPPQSMPLHIHRSLDHRVLQQSIVS